MWQLFAGAGLDLLGGAINRRNAQKVNNDSVTTARQLAKESFEQYNSPLAKRVNLEKAGYNPNLGIDGYTGQSISTPNLQTALQDFSNTQAALSDATQRYMNKKNLEFQEKVLNKDLQLANQDLVNKKAEERKTNAEAEAQEKANSVFDENNSNQQDNLKANTKKINEEIKSIQYTIENILSENARNLKFHNDLNDEQREYIIKSAKYSANKVFYESEMLSREEKKQAAVLTDEFIELYAKNQFKEEELSDLSIELSKSIVTGSAAQNERFQKEMNDIKANMLAGNYNFEQTLQLLLFSIINNPSATTDLIQKFINARK